MIVRWPIKWLCVRILLQSLKLQISRLFRATIECRFTLKGVFDMVRTYSQMHRGDKYSQHSLSIWPVWLNVWVFVYELCGFEFKSRCSHLNFRFCACFEQGVPWYLCNCRVWIHSETLTWHDKNIQSSWQAWEDCFVLKTSLRLADVKRV